MKLDLLRWLQSAGLGCCCVLRNPHNQLTLLAACAALPLAGCEVFLALFRASLYGPGFCWALVNAHRIGSPARMHAVAVSTWQFHGHYYHSITQHTTLTPLTTPTVINSSPAASFQSLMNCMCTACMVAMFRLVCTEVLRRILFATIDSAL